MREIAKEIFSKCESVDSASARESDRWKVYTAFLHFASERLKDNFIYPYWSNMGIEDKDYFLRTCTVDNNGEYNGIYKSIFQINPFYGAIWVK